ncbi:hypothetical protein Tco_1102567 [Tanacetum coccineum]
MSPSAEEVGGYSSDGSSGQGLSRKGASALSDGIERTVSKKKGTFKSHRSWFEDLACPIDAQTSPKLSPLIGITRFRYHRQAKLPPNVRVYEGNKDPEDHLSIFSAAAEQEEWPMPVWCKMFRQTLSGSARNWFDSLDPKSVDGF